MIRCGHCQQGHATVADVRRCAGSTNLLTLEREMDEMVQEGERAQEDAAYQFKMQRDAALAAQDQRRMPHPCQPNLSELIQAIRELLEEREVPQGYQKALEEYLVAPTVTRTGLETAVARLQSHPRRGVRVSEPGMYRAPGGAIYRVQWNKDKTHLYAKRAEKRGDKWELVYAAGVFGTLRAADRMSLEEVEEFGQATGWCAICGRYLTNPESVARGIGPICASRI